MSIPQHIKQRCLNPSDLRSFFRNVLNEAIGISKAEEGGIVSRNDRTGELRVEVFMGAGVEYKKRILGPNPDESICVAAAISKKIQNVPDVKKDSRFHPLSDSKIMSELIIPILYGDHCDGLINLESTRLNAFSPNMEQKVDAFAHSISSNFHSALIDCHRYFLEQQLKAIQEIIEVTLLYMESPSLILKQILNHGLILTEADTGGILLMSDDRECLEIKAHSGLKPEYNGSKIPRGEGFVWKCVESNTLLNIWNVHKFEEIYKDLSTPKINSELVVPLSFHNEVFGVINIESSDYNAFSFEHEQILNMFTQQVALLFQLTQLRKKWEGAWAMARWGDLAGNFAHRINNLIGGVEVLGSRIEKKSVDPSIQRYANQIKESTRDALNIIEEYRARFEWKEDYIDICSTIRDAISQIKVPDNVKVSINVPDCPFTICVPERQIREMCRELVGNSLKCMGEQGEISVSLSSKWDVLLLEVSDTGPGFPSDNKEKLFNRGTRGSTDSIGTGYGLWWIQHLIHALGGEISLENIAKGGRVRVTIPYSSQNQIKEGIK